MNFMLLTSDRLTSFDKNWQELTKIDKNTCHTDCFSVLFLSVIYIFWTYLWNTNITKKKRVLAE